jgi:hypothetical protein
MRRILLAVLTAYLGTRPCLGQAPVNRPPAPLARPLPDLPHRPAPAAITPLAGAPAGQPAAVPSDSGAPSAPDTVASAAFVENLVPFDHRRAEVRWADGRWQLLAGGVLLKDFGKREPEARQALRIIRDLRLTQHGTVGTPTPVMEYWLCDGRAPQGWVAGLQAQPIDVNTLRVDQLQGQWCVRDARQVLFTFGPHEQDARHALAVIRRYGFNKIGYLGHGIPAMICLFAGQDEFRSAAVVPTPLGSRTLMPGQPLPTDNRLIVRKEPPPPELNAQANKPAVVPAMLPHGRQLSDPGTAMANAGGGERIPFDWRMVQVRRDGADWKLECGGYALANFGADERAARQALAVVQHYRFTEQCRIGKPTPTCTYYLVNGQPPRGVSFGVNNVPFRPDALAVAEHEGVYVIAEGNRTVLRCGDRGEDAKQLLQVIQRHKFDHVCHVGSPEPAGMTFFARQR